MFVCEGALMLSMLNFGYINPSSFPFLESPWSNYYYTHSAPHIPLVISIEPAVYRIPWPLVLGSCNWVPRHLRLSLYGHNQECGTLNLQATTWWGPTCCHPYWRGGTWIHAGDQKLNLRFRLNDSFFIFRYCIFFSGTAFFSRPVSPIRISSGLSLVNHKRLIQLLHLNGC